MVHADDNEVELLVRHLAEKHSGTFDESEVADAVQTARSELQQDASQAGFLPVFIQRRAEELLRERADEKGIDLARVQQILFMDDANTGRSQIAAAVANGKGDGLIRARSGGVEPGEQMQGKVADVLHERGYDAPDAKDVTPMTGKATLASDLVVTMGLSDEEKQAMPTHGLHQIDWDDLGSVADLSAEDLRAAFDDIERRVEELVRALLEDGPEGREVDPEVEQEIDEAISSLHDPDTKD